ncbi:protein arginine N-methyltransferase [Kamptonema sp. UHCC 0994]|uniref:protein arginine N-methyltransferase n=1 Tax=Kamptonema sp. UHCC 0994 TaxID=3031329 RepID=UPI0023B90C0F|nr:protein arginine N-methyltransferase [Kamptonema sp. UHCC 0994]MDF0552024.1 protein arginine N-methyltransferase [Kamptonema sp. UHCC 0994]
MMSIEKSFQIALNYQQNEQLQEAESIYLQILAVQRNHIESISNLGVIYKRQGDIEKAIEFYRLALSFDSNYEIGLSNLANCLMELEEFNEALVCFKRLVEIQPDSLNTLRQIGAVLIQKGQLDEAITYFKTALEKLPTDVESHWSIGNILVRQNRLFEARDIFTNILQLHPSHVNSQRWLSFVNHLLSDHHQVAFDYQETAINFEITGKNLGVEIAHTSGHFYELAELEFIDKNVKVKNPVIVDVGANTGNHLVYFAKVMTAAKVIPIEFHPGAIDLLKRNIFLNQLSNVDLSKLGYAVGRFPGKSTLVEHPAGDLCLNEVVASATGEIEVLPLDELVQEPIDLIKIDVEGLEIDVLEGAKKILLKYQPDVIIEVRRVNQKRLMNFLETISYRVLRQFDYWKYSNFYLQPIRELSQPKQLDSQVSLDFFRGKSLEIF